MKANSEIYAKESETTNTSQVVIFDIPQQFLISALDAYGAATGLTIMYDSALAINRHSTAVKGAYSPAAALRLLLQGSGLTARSISTDAITIVVQPIGKPTPSAARPGAGRHRAYFAMIQASFELQFCHDTDINLGRVVLRFRIGRTGAIEHPEVLGLPGNDIRNQAIARSLQRVTLAEPPPLDLAQPIIMLLRFSPTVNPRSCSN